jgi:asparaginyl-tRNA synthetase
MLEAEVNFVQDLASLLDLVESLIRDLIRRVYNAPVCEEILSATRTGESGKEGVDTALRQRWLALIEGGSWPRITYTRAIELLEGVASFKIVSFKFPPSWDAGLQLEHEKFIVDTVGKGAPVFVTDYPKKVKPFYMAPSAATEAAYEVTLSTGMSPPVVPERDTVACFDLLVPEISEVVGGSIREHRLPSLIQNMRDHGLIKIRSTSEPLPASGSFPMAFGPTYPHLLPQEDLGPLRWYADLRRWGSAPHGGFGLGFDRLLGYLAGVASIRDVVPFPRYFGRADC